MQKLKNSFPQTICASLLVVSASLFTSACSHGVKKVDYPSTSNPQDEATKISTDLRDARANQFDVLAADDYNNSRDKLAKAEEQIKDGDDQQDVLTTLGYSRAYLERASAKAASRRQRVDGILQSRRSALNAGASKFPKESEKLRDLDNDLRKMAEDDDTMSPKEFSELQKKYLELELAAIQTDMLGGSRSKIMGARDQDAEKRAPKTLHMAEIDLKNAENMIAANRDQKENYSQAVLKSKESSDKLSMVAAEQEKAGGKLGEDEAVKIVEQRMQLNKQRNQIAALDSTNAALSAKNAETADELAAQNERLQKALADVRVKKAFETARSQFKPSEAEIYEQGDKLLIRVKSIRFQTGKSTLPTASHKVLTKVSAVAAELNPRQVVIEGQTDSRGTKALNEKLSLKRAQSVADFLQEKGIDEGVITTRGRDYQRPLAANKTKAGRADNRRVDVWIVPEGAKDVDFSQGVEKASAFEEEKSTSLQ